MKWEYGEELDQKKTDLNLGSLHQKLNPLSLHSTPLFLLMDVSFVILALSCQKDRVCINNLCQKMRYLDLFIFVYSFFFETQNKMLRSMSELLFSALDGDFYSQGPERT